MRELTKVLGVLALAGFVGLGCDGGDGGADGVPDAGGGGGDADAAVLDAPEADAAPTVTDASPSPPLDPAPGVEMVGENGGVMCPDTDATDFTVVVGAATAVDLAGTVTGLAGTEGTWYVRGAGGQEIAGPFPVDAGGAWAVSLPLLCGGGNVVKLQFPGASCPTTLVYNVASTCTPSELQITMTWDALGDDWELHLVRPEGLLNSAADDCTWTTCIEEVLDWGVVGDTSDDPHKDVDNTGGYGPENIILDKPATGIYTIMVEHWGPGDPLSDGRVILNVGGQAFVFVRNDLVSEFVWTVATITFPGGNVTPVDSVFDCMATWDGGCLAAIP